MVDDSPLQRWSHGARRTEILFLLRKCNLYKICSVICGKVLRSTCWGPGGESLLYHQALPTSHFIHWKLKLHVCLQDWNWELLGLDTEQIKFGEAKMAHGDDQHAFLKKLCLPKCTHANRIQFPILLKLGNYDKLRISQNCASSKEPECISKNRLKISES